MYLQYSIDIATEQSFRYIELTDAKSGFPKMRHYVGFWQIGSQICKIFIKEQTIIDFGFKF